MDFHAPTPKRLLLELLPTDLLALPLVLVLLAVMPPLGAMSLLWLGLLPILGLLYRSGRLASRRQGFIRLGLVSVCFFLLNKFLVPTEVYCLRNQALWLSCFALGSLGHYIYRRWRKYEIKAPTEGCACRRRREEVLQIEYRRLDNILIVFATLMAFLAWPLQYLVCCESWLDRLIAYIGAGVAFAVIVFELIHLRWVERKLCEEVWITQVDEQGKAMQGVPISLYKQAQGRLPFVRLIPYSGDMVYLERTACLISERELIDTPFCSWVHQGLSPDAVAQLLIDQRFCGVHRATPRRILVHKAEVRGLKLQIYLYAVAVPSPELLLGKCTPLQGKWWPLMQVLPLAHQSDFGHWLAEELPLLEQTIILAKQLTASPSLASN